MEKFRDNASGLLLMVFSGQQISWGILKGFGLVDFNMSENKSESFWLVSVWFYGAIIGCRFAMLLNCSKSKLEVRILFEIHINSTQS